MLNTDLIFTIQVAYNLRLKILLLMTTSKILLVFVSGFTGGTFSKEQSWKCSVKKGGKKITWQIFLFGNVLFSVIQSSQYFLRQAEVQQNHRPLWSELQTASQVIKWLWAVSTTPQKSERATDAQGKMVFKFQVVKLHSTWRVIYL